MMDISEKIRILRKNRDMSQGELAKAVGVSLDTVSRWEKGKRSPRYEDIVSLALAFGVSVSALMGEADAAASKEVQHELRSNGRLIPREQLMWVPVISPEVKICAGNGNDYSYSDLEWIVVDRVPIVDGELSALYSADSLLAMYVEGDSMEPQIHDGDLVVFNHDAAWVPGNIMVVCLDGRRMVKGMLSQGEGRPPLLRSANRDYEDISVSADSFFMVYGRVLRILRVTRPKPVI